MEFKVRRTQQGELTGRKSHEGNSYYLMPETLEAIKRLRAKEYPVGSYGKGPTVRDYAYHFLLEGIRHCEETGECPPAKIPKKAEMAQIRIVLDAETGSRVEQIRLKHDRIKTRGITRVAASLIEMGVRRFEK